MHPKRAARVLCFIQQVQLQQPRAALATQAVLRACVFRNSIGRASCSNNKVGIARKLDKNSHAIIQMMRDAAFRPSSQTIHARTHPSVGCFGWDAGEQTACKVLLNEKKPQNVKSETTRAVLTVTNARASTFHLSEEIKCSGRLVVCAVHRKVKNGMLLVAP